MKYLSGKTKGLIISKKTAPLFSMNLKLQLKPIRLKPEAKGA